MEPIFAFFMVPLVLFMLIVAPIWVVMHYSTKRKFLSSLNVQEQTELEILAEEAEKMAERIETLEAILDESTPEWRQRARAQDDG